MTYNPALDGIRALAVLAVVAFHAQVPHSYGGWLGVDLFFVLSGYLISTILADDVARYGRIRWTNFYRRRFARLYPALVAMLSVYVLIAPLVWPAYGALSHLRDAALGALYLTSYTRSTLGHPEYLSHLWSLAVEVHYYLLWPVALAALFKLPTAARMRMAALLAFLATAARLIALSDWTALSLSDTYHFSHLRLSGLMMGSVLGLLLPHIRINKEAATLLGIIGLAGFVALYQSHAWKALWGFRYGVLAAEISAVMLILWASHNPIALANRPMMWIGHYSYGIYLWHYPVVKWMRVEYPWWVTFPVGLFFSVAMAALSYHTIEGFFGSTPHCVEP